MKNEYDLQSHAFCIDAVNIVNVSRDKDYKVSNKGGRPQNGFIYVVQGAINNTFYGSGEVKSIDAFSGDLFFIPRGTSYASTYLEDGTELRIVQFELLSGTLPDYLAAPARIDLPSARELLDEMFTTVKHSVDVSPLFYLSKLYELFWQLEKKHSKIPSKYKRLKPALCDISEHYEMSRQISEYAALCNMSEANFRRLFRECVGMSPIEYRNDIRLRSARIKLQSGEYNVSEAAYDSGFSNLSFFIRLYKKKYGYTPKKE